jgi:hypothetical protein
MRQYFIALSAHISREILGDVAFDVCNLLLFLQLNKILQYLGKMLQFSHSLSLFVSSLPHLSISKGVAVGSCLTDRKKVGVREKKIAGVKVPWKIKLQMD